MVHNLSEPLIKKGHDTTTVEGLIKEKSSVSDMNINKVIRL